MGDFCPQGLGLGFASGDTNSTLFGTTDTCLALVVLGDVSNHDVMYVSVKGRRTKVQSQDLSQSNFH